jgi:surface polysaccharide O-acyltransferase-like enzyme
VEGSSWINIAKCWLKGTLGNLWFMPMIIGLYAITPSILIIKKNITERSFKILGCFIIILAIISQATSTYILPYSLGVIMSYLGYYMMGSVIYDERKKEDKKMCFAQCAIIFSLSIVTTIYRIKVSQEYAIDPYKAFFSPTVVIMSLICFSVFKNIQIKKLKIEIELLSNKTLYVYLIHTIVICILFPVVNSLMKNVMMKIVVVVVLGSVISFCVASIWIRIRMIIDKRFHVKELIIKTRI